MAKEFHTRSVKDYARKFVSAKYKCQKKKAPRDLVLVMKSAAVTTGVTWVKLEKVGRSENPSSSRSQLQSKRNKLLPNARNQISVLHYNLVFLTSNKEHSLVSAGNHAICSVSKCKYLICVVLFQNCLT